MSSKRIISLALSILMIAGLLAAFPAFQASAAITNLALGKKYAYSLAPDKTIYSGTDYAFSEKTQDDANVFHTGYLTDGDTPKVRPGFYANPGYLGYINKVENVSFTIDLEDTYDLTSVTAFLSWDNPPARLASQPTKLEVSYSADGTTFTSAEDIKDKYDTVPLYQRDLTTEYTKGHTHTASNAVSGVRYVRLTVSTPFTQNDAGQYVCRLYISEITVNGEKAGSTPVEETEISKNKKYAYSLAPDNTVYSGTDYAFCETTQDEAGAFHTGFLTDGTKSQVRAGYYSNPGWLGYINKVEDASFTVDLENTYEISSVAVYLSWDNPPARLASQPTKLEVSYSADGTTFTSAEDIKDKYDTVTLYNKDLVTEYTKAHTHTTSNAVSGVRYVRITATTPFTQNDAGQYVCRLYIGEITVMGAASQSSSDPKLAAPVLSISGLSNNTINRYGRYSTYTIPTISWAAVENATAYDVYFNGEKVLSDTTALSYTPTGIEPQRQYGYGDMRMSEACYVVAKGAGYKDSDKSETVEFLLVHKPTDKNGNEVTSADFIIDPGHGGTQSPGACYGERQERYDTLNLAFKYGGYLEAAGYTVAYTRITDVFDNIYTKAAVSQAGDFKAFICNHRNSVANANTAEGVEFYSLDTTSESYYLAKAIETEFVADGIWKNRGCKTNTYVVLKGNVSIPATLIEIGFINSDSDNQKYDTLFAETAQAIARGCIKFIKQPTGYTSTIGETVTTDAAASITDTITEGQPYIVSGKIKNGFGVSKVQFKLDNGEWKDTDLTTLRLITEKSYEATIYDALTAGEHTITVRGVSNWDSTTKYNNTFDIANITLNVEAAAPKTYTVTFSADANGTVNAEQLTVIYGTEYAGITFPAYTANTGYHFKEWQIVTGALSEGLIVEDIEVRAIFEKDPEPSYVIGDVNEDGEIDALDASTILKYDAGIIDLSNAQLQAGDTNHDGEVDALDASLILKYDAGIIDEL